MIVLFQLIAGIILDQLFGEVRRFHPLVGFGWLANFVDKKFPEQSNLRNRFAGLIAMIFIVGSFTLVTWWLASIPAIGMVLSIVIFYFCLGARSLVEHADQVYQSLQNDDLLAAQKAVGMMVSRDSSEMDTTQVSLACVESVLENGNDAVFGTIFWFVLLGAPAVLCFRLVNTLDAMWGYRTDQYEQFGWAAAKFDDLLNWAPARLCALTYALLGKTRTGLDCWKRQAPGWESPNAGPVMAAGAGALNIQLGGVGMYHGEKKVRPVLGEGRVPEAEDIQRAIKLVQYGVIVWILVITVINSGVYIFA